MEPNTKVKIKVTGDAEATVGLVAVDKAVYVLNSKDKLTQKKVSTSCAFGSKCCLDILVELQSSSTPKCNINGCKDASS